MARLPTQRISAIMEAHGKASIDIDHRDEHYAYQAFIRRHTYRREAIEGFCRLPITLQQAQQQVEARVRNRSSWTIAQRTHRIAD